MTDVMMKLGRYTFSVSTASYQALSRSTEYNWGSVGRIGNYSALQFMGESNESFDLSGSIYPQFAGGFSQLDKMRAEAAKGEPLTMVDGRGTVHGKFVIEQITESQDRFFMAGAPKIINFSIRLKRYVE